MMVKFSFWVHFSKIKLKVVLSKSVLTTAIDLEQTLHSGFGSRNGSLEKRLSWWLGT